MPRKRSAIKNTLSLPSQWLQMYDEFIAKNAHQVSQIESTLRSLTYIIPGRFRDAEIASESIHSAAQLLSLYRDTLLRRVHTLAKLPVPPSLSQPPSAHSRYTRFWTLKSALYRRVAYVLQIVQYVELLCEMAAKRRGEQTRWRVVVLLEAVKAFCKLLLMRITRSRPLVTPILPEREPIPDEPSGDEAPEFGMLEEDDEDRRNGTANGGAYANGSAHQHNDPSQLGPNGEWTMPRTGMTLPSLPAPGDTSGYLLSRVLTADDIKPAAKLLNRLQGQAQAAEILHILAPLIFAVALTRSKNKRKAWTPWLLGIGAELAARQLRERGLRTTPLERDEWSRRGWAMGWWAMRGAFYENVTKGVVEGVRRRMPGLLAGILEDYEYLWENYYFSTSS
ncbi:peroxisomal membrane protein pex16-like protein [Parathielavia appendiculata]|uniref:Peroxisomal membrane protein PEX16 n=1 Tax=Parathielavia appendiculata TaxID=2587402 RepID=A0AAN6U2E7_9PEZI|nr:peroxisomal membrane protein pex16-like protein [Parathielavia appendiculata]